MAREKNWAGKKGERFRALEVHEGGQDREEPASQEAEEHVLGCCMLEQTGGDTIAKCLEAKFTNEAFYWPANRVLFDLFVELYRKGLPATIEVVVSELTSRKQLASIGGFPFLSQITGRAPTSAHRGYFIAKVKEKWILRELIREAHAAVEQCHAFTGAEGDTGLEDLIAPLATRFNRAMDYARASQENMQARAARGYQRTLAKLEGKQDKSRQLLTGMAEFDNRFGAFDVFEEDFLIGIAALTSGGKSAFTRKICDYFLQDKKGPDGRLLPKKKGIVFLLETTIAKWLDLAACTAVRVNGRHLDQLLKDQEAAFRKARAEREAWVGERLWIYDDPIKAETLCARVEDHVRQHGPVDFVVVDHLHELYSVSNKFRGQREQELGFIAKELKKTAKRLNTPFFVPTQLNRSSAKDGVLRRPTKHDLRGSGEIENAYDRLILLHIPKEDMRGSEQTENQARVMIEVIQDKSRNGPIGRREFWFDRPFTDYVEIRDHEFERKPNTPGGPANPGGYKR